MPFANTSEPARRAATSTAPTPPITYHPPFRSTRLDPAPGAEPRLPTSVTVSPTQTHAWAKFLAEAVRNGLDPTLVTQWLTILADATGSPVLPSLASMSTTKYVELRLPSILAGLESTTHVPYLAGWHHRIEPDLGHLPIRLVTTGAIATAIDSWISEDCSRSTIKNTLAMLFRILEQAVVDGLIERPPHTSPAGNTPTSRPRTSSWTLGPSP